MSKLMTVFPVALLKGAKKGRERKKKRTERSSGRLGNVESSREHRGQVKVVFVFNDVYSGGVYLCFASCRDEGEFWVPLVEKGNPLL